MARIERQDVTTTVIVQHVGGDLRVRGREGADLLVDGERPTIERLGEGQPYLVRCDGDCRMVVPQNVDLVVQQVGGDARLTDLGQSLELGAVGGDAVIRNAHHVQLKAVGGDLRIKWVDGDVTIQTVGADATIREVCGAVRVERVGADLYLRNIEGSCIVEQVGADLLLNVEFAPENEYRFRVGGDILCRAPAGTSARFVMPAHMSVDLDIEAGVTESEDGTQQIITIGDGQTLVLIEDGDGLRLVGEAEDYVINLGSQIEEEIEARMSSLEEQLSQHLSGLDKRLQTWTDQFTPQAERIAERAQRQAERAMERVRRNLERQRGSKRKRAFGARSFEFSWSGTAGSSAAPQPKAEPVTEAERLMVLRMLQDGKISLEEAERLLAALDAPDQGV